MPIRRFRPRRTRSRTFKRRAWRRFTRIYKRRRPLRIHSFKRTCILSPITVNNAGVASELTFKLSDLPDYTDFQSLFDQYRIKAVKIQFVPNFTNSPMTASVNSIGMHSIHSAIDHNSSTDPPAVLDLMQIDTYKRTRLDRGLKRYFKVNTIDSWGATTNVETGWNKWLSTENGSAVEYYGLRYVIDALEEDVSCTLDVFATYYFQCKSVI